MKKYLFRAGFNPTITYNTKDILQKDSFGGNTGNVVYAAGTMNVLAKEDTVIDSTYYWPEWSNGEWSEEKVERINSEYNAFIIPMADAFRPDFTHHLDEYTKLLKQLTIPCIVIGIGLRAPYEPEVERKRPFDESVKAFVTEILNHSACLGLRGEITGRYLSRLGFMEGRDFQVIGCPSLFMHGTSIAYRDISDSISKYCTNTNKNYANRISSDFLVKSCDQFSNSFLIQQRYIEAKDIILRPTRKSEDIYVFDQSTVARMKKQNRIKFFTSIPEWQLFLEDADLFVGNRFHGIAMAILSGTPSVMIPFDGRTRELTEFHHIPSIPEKDIKEGSTIIDCLETIDFTSFKKNHLAGVLNYKDFLEKNGIDSILGEKLEWPLGSSAFERRILDQGIRSDIVCYDVVNIATKINRTLCEGKNKLARMKRRIIRKILRNNPQ